MNDRSTRASRGNRLKAIAERRVLAAPLDMEQWLSMYFTSELI